jgi:pyrimidine-nucleoside phosphorylase
MTAQRAPWTTAQLIAHKRDGYELSAAQIAWLVRAFIRGEVADYQMTAFAMAVVLRGMTARETVALTLAMRDSGRRVRLRGKMPVVDKHSTGGVGDKVSLCLGPLVAACGVRVPMIAGRGLGHTGGTIDKLEAIPGFRTALSLKRFQAQVRRVGIAIGGQTAEIAPADRRLYALRDVTGTVESIPLITASILSKKLAEDLDALVLDVKVGRGAFMKTRAEARALAWSLVRVGRGAGLRVTALLTAMDAPLGRAVGNALEVAEAIEVLHGRGPDDTRGCTLALGAEMLVAAGVARSRRDARRMLAQAIRDGRALRVMRTMVRAQGGDARVVDEPDRLPRARHVVVLRAPRNGYVRALDAHAVGGLACRLGTGRTTADDTIDPAVGIVFHAKPGDSVRRGAPLAELHLVSATHAAWARPALLAAYAFGKRPPRPSPLFLERIG